MSGTVNYLIYFLKSLNIASACHTIYQEEKKEKPNRTNQIAQAAFAALQMVDLGTKIKCGDTLQNHQQMVTRMAVGLADVVRVATAGGSLTDVLVTATSQTADCLNLSVEQNFCSSEHKSKIVDVAKMIDGVAMVINSRHNLKNTAEAILNRILPPQPALVTVENRSEASSSINPSGPAALEHNRFQLNRNILRSVVSFATDENFLDWVRVHAPYRRFLCAVTGHFIIDPVRLRHHYRDIWVEKLTLDYARREGFTGITVSGIRFSLSDIDGVVDLVKKKTQEIWLKNLSERFLHLQEIVGLCDAIIATDFDAERGRQILPDEFDQIYDTTHWVRCQISGQLIHVVAAPALTQEQQANAPQVYYEMSILEEWRHAHPKQQPPGWPANVPFNRRNFGTHPMQNLINRHIRALKQTARDKLQMINVQIPLHFLRRSYRIEIHQERRREANEEKEQRIA